MIIRLLKNLKRSKVITRYIYDIIINYNIRKRLKKEN